MVVQEVILISNVEQLWWNFAGVPLIGVLMHDQLGSIIIEGQLSLKNKQVLVVCIALIV